MNCCWRTKKCGSTPDGRNGGAERAAWDTLLDVYKYDHKAGQMDQGVVTLVS